MDVWQLLLVLFLLEPPPGSDALQLHSCHARALGMESGEIEDEQLSASSSFDQQSVGPQNARIRTERASGAWCPKPQIHENSYEFIQINLRETHLITAVETQGRFGNGTGREFPTEYMIDYLRPGSNWIRYRNRTGFQMMTGNSDTQTAVLRTLDPPILASRIRLVPFSRTMRTMCLRLELYGCLSPTGLMFYFVSPDGSRFGDLDFRDPNFEEVDVQTNNGSKIRRGLGLLSDGFIAEKSPYDSTGKNASWIGWNQLQTGGIVEMNFEFDRLRNFSELELCAFGDRIDEVEMLFSQDGTHFPESSQIASRTKESAEEETPRAFRLRVPLHMRRAIALKVTLKFAADWLFLTEVHFASDLHNSNALNLQSMLPPLSTVTSVPDERLPTDSQHPITHNVFSVVALILLLLFITCVLCALLIVRRRLPMKKKAMYTNGGCKADMIVTAMGRGPSNHRSFLSLKNDSGYIQDAKNEFIMPPPPPTWSDFHFPPPPSCLDFNEMDQQQPRVAVRPIPNPRTLPRTHSNKQQILLNGDDELHYASTSIAESPNGLEHVPKFLHESLILREDLGRGKYTAVYRCEVPVIGRVAYKTPTDKENLMIRKALRSEARQLTRVNSKNVIRLLGRDDLGLLLEFAPQGNLRGFIQRYSHNLDPDALLHMCTEVAAGMMALEERRIVHGHLTTSHCLVFDGMSVKTFVQNTCGIAGDVWSFACVAWEVFGYCERLPYVDLDSSALVENAEKIVAGDPNALMLDFGKVCFGRELAILLENCHRSQPRSRPSFLAIHRTLSSFHLPSPT